MPDRRAHRQLDESLVGLIVAEQFPEFARQMPVRLGEGDDNRAFVFAGEWVFRFPRRANRVRWQRREAVILDIASHALGSLVPKISYEGRRGELFPHPFIGYRLVEGVAAGTAGLPLGGLAVQLGDALGRLHAVDTSGVPATPGGWEQDPPDALRQEVAAQAAAIRGALPRDMHRVAAPWLTGAARPPRANFTPRFCHNDICAEHVLVKADGALSGLIDWTDAMVTDPALDFAGLITIAGWPFIRQVLAHYPLPVDAGFSRRLRWLTRALTLHWLADAAENHEPVERHVTWVRRAFSAFG